jgi:PAS domain-containing protein
VKRLIPPQTQPANTATVPLEESAFLQAVVDAIPGMFYVIDERGYFVRWNRAAQELVGTPDARMPRTTFSMPFARKIVLIASLIQGALAKVC